MSAASVISTVATKQALALVKGPGQGAHGSSSAMHLRLLEDKASIPVGAPSMTGGTHYVRFGKVPKGAKIIANLSRLVTDHTATIAGKLSLVPLSGATAVDIASVTVQLEALAVAHDATSMTVETGSLLDAVDSVVATEDSWVHFIPASDLTIASTAKNIWARIAYGMPY